MNLKLISGLISIALLIGAFAFGDYHGHKVMQLKIEKANKLALQLKQVQQEKIDGITQKHIDAMAIITNQRDVYLNRLRSRSNRMPKTSKTNCKGATGAELSRPDAEFLTGQIAARADKIREALSTCYRYADSLQ